ncbi:hypothetical protein F4859DRAFT_513394 [Xylaria cf. heliscus]|nr:hypothetical protein F4859DRAFT_513394 [Xylaria cf. heliscus]
MSPTYTMSAHLCKEIYKSFQNRQTSPEPNSANPPNVNQAPSTWSIRRSPSPAKRTSVDSDRSDSSSASGASMSRSPSSSGLGLGELAFTATATETEIPAEHYTF